MNEEKSYHGYRSTTHRADWHDYDGGIYFITICTKNMIHYFGEIVSEEQGMVLSEMGNAAADCLRQIPNHNEFADIMSNAIMPNHLHVLITIDELFHNHLPLLSRKFGPKSNNLASIVRGFKAGVTKYARTHRIEFEWQPNYYDRIVRNQKQLERIIYYIENNVDACFEPNDNNWL